MAVAALLVLAVGALILTRVTLNLLGFIGDREPPLPPLALPGGVQRYPLELPGGAVHLRSRAAAVHRVALGNSGVVRYRLDDATGSLAWEAPSGLAVRGGEDCALSVDADGRPLAFANYTQALAWDLPVTLRRPVPKVLWVVAVTCWLLVAVGVLVVVASLATSVLAALVGLWDSWSLRIPLVGSTIGFPNVDQLSGGIATISLTIAVVVLVAAVVIHRAVGNRNWRQPRCQARIGNQTDWHDFRPQEMDLLSSPGAGVDGRSRGFRAAGARRRSR